MRFKGSCLCDYLPKNIVTDGWIYVWYSRENKGGYGVCACGQCVVLVVFVGLSVSVGGACVVCDREGD